MTGKCGATAACCTSVGCRHRHGGVSRARFDGARPTLTTGVGREYPGRGVATAIKVEALSRAKAKGLRATLTTNDEPNKARREVNAALGYQILPAYVQLEKPLLH